jgi:hypothetical protein
MLAGLGTGLVVCAGLATVIGLLAGGTWFVRIVSAALAPSVPAEKRLEALSFLANISVPLIALFAGYFAYNQVIEAKNTRIASLYLQINETYNSEIVRAARRELKALQENFDTDRMQGEAMPAYIARRLNEWSREKLATPDFEKFNKCMRLMEFWEEVGVLTRRNLIERDVLFDYLAGAATYAEDCFGLYLQGRRTADGSNKLYANALYLMSEARQAKPSTF